MAQNREVIPLMLFNMRGAYIDQLWTPSTEYEGKPRDKPSYNVTAITPKTNARPQQTHLPDVPAWMHEPALQPLVDVCRRLYAMYFPQMPLNLLKWPVKDGDLPNKKGVVPEWSKGHWLVMANTSSAPPVEGVVDGKAQPVPSRMIGGRALWEDGDLMAMTLGAAKRGDAAMGIKLYLNGVLFTGKGERIAIGIARVSGEEMLAKAREQGIAVTGIGGQVLQQQENIGQPAQSTGNPFPGVGSAPTGAAPF